MNTEHDRRPVRRSGLRIGLSLLATALRMALGDNLAQLGLLGFVVLLPLVLLALAGPYGGRRAQAGRP